MRGIAVILAALLAVAHAGNQCPAEQEQDWSIDVLLVHGDCNKFYKCAFGVPVPQVCPGDLLFNTEEMVCDWRHNVDCGDRNVPGVKPEPEIQPKPEVEPEPEVELEPEVQPEPEVELKPEVKPEPEKEPHPEVEEPEIEDIFTEEPEIEESFTEEPEIEEIIPEKPEIEEIIPEEPQIEVEEGSGEESNEIEFQENGCPVDPFIHWLKPSSEDCSVFYQCVWGEPVQRKCSGSLYFNPVLQVCDWPDRAGCVLREKEVDSSDESDDSSDENNDSSEENNDSSEEGSGEVDSSNDHDARRHKYQGVVDVGVGLRFKDLM